MELTLYQIYYRPEHLGMLDPCCIPYDNAEARSPFFENEVIKSLISNYCHLGCDYFGVISWSFTRKIKIPGGVMDFNKILQLMEHKKGYDVYSFFGKHHPHNPFDPKNNGHGRALLELAQMLCQRMNLNIDMKTWIADKQVYMNYFIARPHVYERYVNDFLIPAMNHMSNPDDDRLYRLVWSNSLYIESSIRLVERNRLKRMYGKPYYPFHAFVCERLFTLWYSLNSHTYSLNQLI